MTELLCPLFIALVGIQIGRRLERTERPQRIIANLDKLARQQRAMPPEFARIVEEDFWELLA